MALHKCHIFELLSFQTSACEHSFMKTIMKFFDKYANTQFQLKLKKCSTVSLKAGRVKKEGDLLTTRGSTITELYNLQSYKYLGVHQTIAQVKGRIRRVVEEEYLKRVTQAWSAGLNTKNTTPGLWPSCGTSSIQEYTERATPGTWKERPEPPFAD